MSDQIQKLFDTISPTYDTLNHVLSFGIDKGWRKKALSDLKLDRGAPVAALDVCAGTLDFSLEFLRQYPQSKVTAVDFSPRMLEAGLKKIPAEKTDRIKTVCADALHLPFPDQVFDIAFCAYGMRNVDDNKAGIKEIARVLKPGGLFLVLEFFRPNNFITKMFHTTYGRFWLPFMGGLISGQRQAYTYLHQSIQKYYFLKDYASLMEECGLTVVGTRDFFGGVSSAIIGKRIPEAR